MRNAYQIFVGSFYDKMSQEQNVGWRIILKWILNKKDMKMLTGFIWLRMGSIGLL
jgi:hypothetical protein